jgi:hypothetical protein
LFIGILYISLHKGNINPIKKPKEMSSPRFFQAVLQEIQGNVLDHVYPQFQGDNQLTLEERMGFNANCPDCDCNSWILLPKESVMVSEGGKPYCECMNCGLVTHL